MSPRVLRLERVLEGEAQVFGGQGREPTAPTFVRDERCHAQALGGALRYLAFGRRPLRHRAYALLGLLSAGQQESERQHDTKPKSHRVE